MVFRSDLTSRLLILVCWLVVGNTSACFRLIVQFMKALLWGKTRLSGNAIENMKISVIFEAVEAFFFSDPFSFFFFFDILKSKKFQRWKQKSKKQEEVLYCSVHSVYKPLEKFSWKKWIPSRDFSIGANISIRIIIFRRCIDLGDTDGWQG